MYSWLRLSFNLIVRSSRRALIALMLTQLAINIAITPLRVQVGWAFGFSSTQVLPRIPSPPRPATTTRIAPKTPAKPKATLNVLFGSKESNDYNGTAATNRTIVTAISSYGRLVSNRSSTATVVPIGKAALNTTSSSTSKASRKVLDNVTKFEHDVATVIKDIRSGEDATLPALFRHGTKLSLSNLWTSTEWDRHASRWRFVRYIIRMHKSRLLRRIAPQLIVTVLWSVTVFQVLASQQAPAILTKVDISLTSLSLVSSFIAALVTLRSNEGLRRLTEARNAWGTMVAILRDTAQLLASYISPYDMELGLLSARHLAMFGWLLKSQLRDESSGDIVNTMLRNPTDAAYVLSQRKRPAALILRIRQIGGFMAGKNRLPYPAHQAVENNLLELNRIIGHCERIKSTCIPPLCELVPISMCDFPLLYSDSIQYNSISRRLHIHVSLDLICCLTWYIHLKSLVLFTNIQTLPMFRGCLCSIYSFCLLP